MKVYISLLLLGMLLFGCVDAPITDTNTTNQSNTTLPDMNITNTSNLSDSNETALPADYSVDIGDTVWVNYTLWVDGKVYDTNNKTLAKKEGIYNAQRVYEPLQFGVLFDGRMIEGFVINVIGMRINETVSFNVSPERGYGKHDPSKILVVPRYYNKSLYETIPRSYLEAQGVNVTEGEGFNTESGTVFIESIDGENVTLFYILSPGSTFTYNGMPQKVINLTNLTATIEYVLDVNSSYVLPHPATMEPTRFLVADKTNESIILDPNHPLAEKNLRFEVTLVDAKPAESN